MRSDFSTSSPHSSRHPLRERKTCRVRKNNTNDFSCHILLADVRTESPGCYERDRRICFWAKGKISFIRLYNPIAVKTYLSRLSSPTLETSRRRHCIPGLWEIGTLIKTTVSEHDPEISCSQLSAAHLSNWTLRL